jgi:hypothetical protein
MNSATSYYCACNTQEVYDLSSLYYCPFCVKLCCELCVTFEIETLYCSNCLLNVANTEAKIYANRFFFDVTFCNLYFNNYIIVVAANVANVLYVFVHWLFCLCLKVVISLVVTTASGLLLKLIW